MRMGMNAELLSLMCCPETRQELRPAEPALVSKLNEQIEAGTLRNRAGQVVKEKLAGGLLRRDEMVVYPIRGIPVLLIEEGIPMDQCKT
jgi:uncharacterized protein